MQKCSMFGCETLRSVTRDGPNPFVCNDCLEKLKQAVKQEAEEKTPAGIRTRMTPEPLNNEPQYTSREVVELSGATRRQLQTWDERNVLNPKVHQHRKLYSREQVKQAELLRKLAAAGLSVTRAHPKPYLTVQRATAKL